MIAYDLPVSVSVGGRDYSIRSDYRAILDIITALNDPDLTQEDRGAVMLGIFYPDEIPADVDAAIKECFRFIAGGEERPEKPGPRLVDWSKDFRWIVSPINRMLGHDVRSVQMHWWTFLSLYYEIPGDCTFAKIVHIREARAMGQKLDKADRDWLTRNADLVKIEQVYSSEEEDLLKTWTGGGMSNAE